jgi:small subunit ribosomal protein S15
MKSKHLLSQIYTMKELTKVGSTEFQICTLTEKVARLTSHLKSHNKDFSSQRGLRKILGKRKRLLTYLYTQDLLKYNNLITNLRIRGTKKISSN